MFLDIFVLIVLLGILRTAASELPPEVPSLDAPYVIRHGLQTPRTVSIGPKPPFRPMPSSTQRDRECIVKSNGSGDDSANIMEAIKACNNGGRVVFSRGAKYTIGTALDLSTLSHIDLDIQGTIQFTSDTSYWTKHGFKHGFQDALTFFQLGGTDVNVYGGGTLDGNGGTWGSKSPRPILFGTIGLKGGTISDLNLKNSPQWFNLVKDSRDVVFSNIRMNGHNHNTDGWDTLKSTNIVIQNSHIDNGDDCISFKPGSIDVLVQNLVCIGSHGISVGSLGQYKNQVDIVENIYVHNVTMSNASAGARIKTWTGGHGTMSGNLEGGGGSGRVNNITYDQMRVSNVDYAIEITQCYGEKDIAKCRAEPSRMTISNVLMDGFSGTTSGKRGNVVGSLTCASSNCKNIVMKNINVRAPSGGKGLSCTGVKAAGC